MPSRYHYEYCRSHIDTAAEIMDREGNLYQGIIRSVDHQNVYLDPLPEVYTGDPSGHGSYWFGGYGPWFRTFLPFAEVGFIKPFLFFS